jgi:hypothetical protein
MVGEEYNLRTSSCFLLLWPVITSSRGSKYILSAFVAICPESKFIADKVLCPCRIAVNIKVLIIVFKGSREDVVW